MICVYPADCTDFSTNGNGTIEPTSALVTETLNGEYELQLVHPIDDAGKWQRLVEGCILRAPVPAATTPRVHFSAPGDDSGTEIYRIHTDFPGAETRKGTLNLRSGPGRNYKILAAYKNTLTVQVIAKTSSAWYEVTAPDGKHGYMDTTYLVYDHTEGSASEATSSVVESRQLRDQPFRIYRVVPELDKITVYARHVFYDLLDNMIKSYKPSSSAVGASVVQTISSSCLSEHDFTFYSDLDSQAEDVEFENCNPVDALLGEGGVVEKYTGELTRDWWDVYVVKRVGQDSNVQIRQAKNLLGISYDIDLTDVVTRIMPTGEDADGNVLYLPELFLDSPLIGSYTHPKWIHLAVSEAKEKTDGDDKKTKEQCYAEMRSQAQAQFDAGCDTPTVTLSVDFINCADTEEYGDTSGAQIAVEAVTVYTLGSRLLKKGSSGADVKALQELLNQLGAALEVDGQFGGKTEAAVKAFQKKAEIKQDGKYGDQTHAALMAAVAEDDAGQQAMTETQPEPEQEQSVAGQTTIRVKIKSSGGNVNIRTGNGTSYSRITAVAPGTTLEYVASAFNGWQAVKIGSQVGWVSGEYSEITSE